MCAAGAAADAVVQWNVQGSPWTSDASAGGSILRAQAAESVQEIASAQPLPEEFTLMFDARYATPHAGMGNGTEPKGHFPHWRVVLLREGERDRLWVEDSWAWNGLILYVDGKPVKHVPGVRPQNQWCSYQITRKADRVAVVVNGMLILDEAVPVAGRSTLHLVAMHLNLEVRGMTCGAVTDAKAGPNDPAFDTSFADGVLPGAWQASGTWNIVPDPSDPARKILQCTSEKAVYTLNSLAQGYDDYTLRMRVLFDTPYKAYSDNDNVHWPHWGVLIRSSTEGKPDLKFADQYIWNNHFLEIGGQIAGGSPRRISKGKWHDVTITARRGMYSVSVDGQLVDQRRLLQVARKGGVGFYVMDGTLQIASLSIRPDTQARDTEPLVSISPLAVGSIYAPGEPIGVRCRVANESRAQAMNLTVQCRLTRLDGGELNTVREEITLAAGQTAEPKLTLTVGVPGRYGITAEVRNGSQVVESFKSIATVLEPLGQRSAAYWPKLGVNAASDLLGVAARAGSGWLRADAIYRGWEAKDGANFTGAENAVKPIVANRDTRPVYLYMDSGRGHTLEGIAGVARKFGMAAGHFKGQYLEVWNEPNHPGFWRLSPINAYDYVPVLQESYLAAKKADPTSTILGICTSEAALDYIEEVMAGGGWAYMDVLAWHPYGYPEAPETRLVNKAAAVQAIVENYGGWLDHNLTEDGYPSGSNARGLPEDRQAQMLVRTQLLANSLDYMQAVIVYRLEDVGDDDGDVEHRFGMLHTDRSTKPAYVALAAMSRMLLNTQYVGTLSPAAGQFIQLYQRHDGSYVVAAWAVDDATVSLPQLSAELSCTDMLGSMQQRAGAALQLTPSPQYLQLSPDQGRPLAQAAALARLHGAVATATAESKAPSDLLACRDLLARQLDRIGADQSATTFQRALALYRLYRAELALAGAASASGMVLSTEPRSQLLQEAERMVTTSDGGCGSLVFSRRILAKAREHLRRGEALRAERSPLAENELHLATRTVAIARAMASAEQPLPLATLANVLPKNITAAAGAEVPVQVAIASGEATPTAFAVEFFGGIASPVRHTWTLAPGERRVEQVILPLPAGMASGEVTAWMTASANGREITRRPVRVTVADPVAITLKPVSKPAAGQVAAVVVNQLDAPVSCKLAGTPVQLAARECREMQFAVSPTGEGMVRIEAAGGRGWKRTFELPLDVAAVSRAAGVKPDGDLSEWSGVPGVHLLHGSPEPATLSAVAKAMYDNRYLYLAIDVRDDVHSQRFSGADLWKGDSIQVSIDPKLERTEGRYGPNDVELGFALPSNSAAPVAVRYVGPDDAIVGRMQYAVKRDDAAHRTTYEAAIPLAQLGSLALKPGMQIGLNFAVHDADAKGERERVAEFTPGTSWPKSPSLYARWAVLP